MTTVRQLSFAAGEIAPSLYGRIDTVKYSTGVRTMRNFFVMRHGGASNRPGTEFIGEVKDSSKTVRLIPFVFSTDQTYILEFGDAYIRIIHDGAYVSDLTLTITGITNANPAVLTYTGTDPANGDQFDISGVLGMTEVNNRRFAVANVNTGANTFELDYIDGTNVNSLPFGTYTSGGSAFRVYTVSSPYAEADLPTLKYIQSADVVTIVHNSYAPRELTRSGHASWTLSSITFAPSLTPPNSLSGGAGTFLKYQVTAVKEETFEESIASSTLSCGTVEPTPTAVNQITWNDTNTPDAREFNVYRLLNGQPGFIGTAVSESFNDIGTVPDTTDTPPKTRNPFSGSTNWPAAVAYIQQRLMFANSTSNPEKVWGSRIGFFKNFTISTPIQSDDAVTFTMAGRQVNRVKHLVDLGKLLIFTESGEWSINGDANGTITPADINPKQHGYNGASDLAPIVIGSTALYVQARGSIIRDFIFNFETDGYAGNDLTIFSAHLFDNFIIEDWTFQQIPHSILWSARDDGTLVGLTYVKEHELVGWHKHDFSNGAVENVCVIPEATEDVLYLVVNRTIDGKTVRYVEKMHSRHIDDIVDSVFLDSSLTYDGRNTDSSHTMTLSGGTNWDYTETLTITSSNNYFTALDVGKAIFLTGSDGTLIRIVIDTYSSVNVIFGKPDKTVPVSMRSVAISDWSLAVDTVSGIWHLEGEDVSIFADGYVVANPNNSSVNSVTVTDGEASLGDHYAVVHVGLPIIADIETLDIDTVGGETMIDKRKLINKVSATLEKSRGLWAGAKPPTDDDTNPLEGLDELKIRQDEGYDEPVSLATETVEIPIKSEWNSNGRVFLRQVDPIPLTILSVAPAGLIPFPNRGGGYG